MRRPLLARNTKIVVTFFVTLATGVAGCAAIAGINDAAESTKSTGDGSPGADGTMSSNEGGGGTGDGAGSCVPKVTQQPTGAVIAHQAMTPPQIDAKFDEWACIDRIDIGQGAFEKDMPGGKTGPQRVEFAMQWTPTDLYFYAHAITVAPGFDNTGSQVFANDSVHLIIGRDPPPASASFRNGDHQLAFDYKGEVGDYVNGSPIMGSTLARAATSPPADPTTLDFQIEARITAASLGLTGGFSSGQKLVFNIMLVDAITMTSIGFRIWRLPQPSTCPCDSTMAGSCCSRTDNTQDSPTCDIRCTESLQLE